MNRPCRARLGWSERTGAGSGRWTPRFACPAPCCRDPATRWCLTLTARREAAAHACARHRPGPGQPVKRPPTSLATRLGRPAAPGHGAAAFRPGGRNPGPPGAPGRPRSRRRAACTPGRWAVPRPLPRYHPPRHLQHLARIRNPSHPPRVPAPPALRLATPRMPGAPAFTGSPLPLPPPGQASPGLDSHPAPARHLRPAHALRPHLHHHAAGLPRMTGRRRVITAPALPDPCRSWRRAG